jgi:hypothetical protein
VKNKGTKSGFCSSLDWGEWESEIVWYDLQGVYQLDEDRRVTITLSDRGYHDHWTCFEVAVLNKHQGEIASKVFRFVDYLGEPSNYGCGGCPRGFQVVGHVGWKWYIEAPKSTLPLTQEVFSWINEFK